MPFYSEKFENENNPLDEYFFKHYYKHYLSNQNKN